MKKKVVTGIALTVLLIGMLTLAFNFKLVKAQNEAELPIYVVGDYWYFQYQNLTNPYSPWNLTQLVIGEEAVSEIDCYVMNITYEPDTPLNYSGAFNDMKGWSAMSSPLHPMKFEVHGDIYVGPTCYDWVANKSFTYEKLAGPDFWPLMVNKALKLNTTTTREVWTIAVNGTPIPPVNTVHKEWSNVTWVKVEAIENIVVLGVTYEDCFKIVTYDETNTTVISREWYSPEAAIAVKSENYVTQEYYDLISFHKSDVVPYVSRNVALNYTFSTNDTDPVSRSFSYNSSANHIFSPPDANGVVNITIPKESISNISWFDTPNVKIEAFPVSDGYGKLYTLNNTGDVDIKSMTNDTGMFFWKNGAWHPPGEEWIGDGTTDPAGSSWITIPYNVSVYHMPPHWILSSSLPQVWYTTGFSENTVDEPASRLNGLYVNATGVPYPSPFVRGVATYVETKARLNTSMYLFLNTSYPLGKLDTQSSEVMTVAPPPVFMAHTFPSPNIYITDPANRRIGTDPITGQFINEIPGAFYSGPGSEPQRVIIPDPLDGVYYIRLVGTSTENYTLVVELATLEKTTSHTYTGNITAGQILATEAIISEGEMTSEQPVSIPVGGIYIPVNKLALLAPYIALASTILVATVATAATTIYIKHFKRRKKKQ